MPKNFLVPACGYTVEKDAEITAVHTAFEARYPQDFYFTGEYHNFYELVYVADGIAEITANNNIHTLESGELVIHPPMEFHRLRSKGLRELHVIIISFSAVRIPNTLQRTFSLKDGGKEMIKEIAGQFYKNFQRNGIYVSSPADGCALACEMTVKKLELFLLSLYSKSPKEMRAYSDPLTGSAKKYTEIVGIMEQNIDKKLCIDELADKCRTSPSNLKKIIRKYTGLGVMKYYNELKIKRAASYLREDRSIKETAALTGFDNQNYFSFVFKKITGKSPYRYKLELREYHNI